MMLCQGRQGTLNPLLARSISKITSYFQSGKIASPFPYRPISYVKPQICFLSKNHFFLDSYIIRVKISSNTTTDNKTTNKKGSPMLPENSDRGQAIYGFERNQGELANPCWKCQKAERTHGKYCAACRAKLDKANAKSRRNRSAINNAMDSIGLKRVHGNLGSSYWE